MKLDITMEEWLKELGRLENECPETEGWFTTKELRARMGRSEDWVRERIGQGIAQGIIEVKRRPVSTIDGRQVLSPCYRKVKEKKK